MEMKTEHAAIRRGVSWSPGGLRKPLQATQDVHTPGTECSALWGKTDFNKEQMSQKTNLTRSASLSEKELKDARVRSHLIASQLTVPSNSNSRGVQLFNRRKQRVSAFTLESSGGRSQEDKEQSVKTDPSTNKPTCAERNSEENDRNLNLKNGSTKILSPSPLRVPAVGDIMEEPNKDYHTEDLKDSIILERHFLPVKEEQEEEIQESKDEDEVFIETKRDPVMMGNVEREAKIIGGQTEPAPFTVTLNGCHSTSTSDRVSTIVNRTARPFFSPPPVQSPEATSPTMGIPPPPSYDTPPLPAFTAPQPVTFSPPPPPPSYPTPPLPAFTNQPPQAYYTSPPPMSPVKSPTSPPPSQIPASSISRYPPMPHYGPPTAPKPSTSAPEPMSERKTVSPIKTGVLEDGTTRRAARKSMFTFKEKPVVAPNPELLSLVQGVDEKKKHQHRSVPEPTSEEELMALGAEASNFLAKEEARVEEAKAPEWTSCLKSSRTKPRAEHRPEQNLTNVSGKGAELFAKRQSRMEKYVIEKQDANKMRAPSPTMSLPPSWVYPSNMPGRVKAIVKNTDISAQLSHNPKTQQVAKPKQRPKAPVPEPAPEPLENGCSKIEMDLSRHQPYQIDPSLFTFSPVQEPLKYLPKRAPQKNQKFGKPLSRHASLPSNPPTHYRPQCMSPQQMPSPREGAEREETPVLVQPRISSAMAVLSPERESSPRCAIQAPRPTFCAKKAGLEAQTPTDSATVETCRETTQPTRTPSFTRSSSSPESTTSGTWTSSLQINCPSNTTASSANRSFTAPMSPPPVTRCLSPLTNQNTHISNTDPTPIFRPTVTSPCSPRWGSRCQSPAISKNTCSSVSNATSRPTYKSTTTFPASPPWGSRCQSPIVSQNTSTNISSSMSKPSQTTSPICPPWGSRCQSPMTSPSATTANFISPARPSQTQSATSPVSPPWGSRCQSPMVNQSGAISSSTSKPSPTTPLPTSPMSPPWGSRSQSPAPSHSSLSFSTTKPLYTSSATSPISPSKDSRCMSPIVNNLDSKPNHRLLAKNIINAAKRKNSPSPGALSGHSFPISPLGNSHHGYDCQKSPTSPFQSRALGARSPIFTSPPPTPTQRICSPVRLYNTRSLTDSDASIESEDSGLRSPGLHSYNTCPRGWGGSLRVKRSTVSTDL